MKTPPIGTRCYSYIRFSTPAQAQGDSMERQIRLSREWARQHGIEFDESLCITDLGKSAYKGDHVRDGALGDFIELVNDGQVPKGSYLLVENLDRLSREGLWKAHTQFHQLITAGIRITTLCDGRTYDTESEDDLTSLLISLTTMFRAHEESAIKSQRGRSVWRALRQRAEKGKIITKRVPGWIRIVNEHFEVDEERANIVRMIFKMYLEDGLGTSTISARLNGKAIPTLGRAKGWHQQCVHQVLSNPAVVGRIVLKTFVGRKRVPDRVVEDYYPRIISDEDFDATQDRFKSNYRTGAGGGRIFNNLFTKKIFCGYCKSPAYIVINNHGRKRHYMVCSTARRGMGCKYRIWHYAEIEEAILNLIANELRVADLVSDDHSGELVALESKMAILQRMIDAAERRIRNSMDAIADYDGDDPKSFRREMMSRHDESVEKKKALRLEYIELEKAHARLSSSKTEASAQLRSVKELIKKMDAVKDDPEARLTLRAKLRQRVSAIMTSVIIWNDIKTALVRLRSGRIRMVYGPGVNGLTIRNLMGDDPCVIDKFTDEMDIRIRFDKDGNPITEYVQSLDPIRPAKERRKPIEEEDEE